VSKKPGAVQSIPIPNNPISDIKKPPPSKPRDRRLEGGEEAKVLAACREGRNKLIEPITRFAIETGMRRGELLALTWKDINLDNRTLHIEHTKNGHPRTIPLSSEAVNLLRGLEALSERTGNVFPMTRNSLKLAWQRVVKRAGVEDLHFHDLRHEAISRFFERGLSIPEVALISGHRDPRMLFRYTHLKAEDLAHKLG
jgi:integrase